MDSFSMAVGQIEALDCSKLMVVSRVMIKPSSPTLNQEKIVRFSLIDQLALNAYVPMLLFYQNTPSSNTEATSMLLKNSLSKNLVEFYPLAGRIHQNELINCTDEGAEFCEAHHSENVMDFLEKNPSLDDLQELLPFKELSPVPGSTPRHKNIVLSAQVNYFSCGGMAVGVCLHHKVADAEACVDFLTAWAANAQACFDNNNHGSHVFRPMFNGASLFPPLKELMSADILAAENEQTFMSKEKVSVRRLIFDKKAIDELKAQAIAANAIIRPSRVEVVIAFICAQWPIKFTSVLQIVNLRKRMLPPVHQGFFGNCAWVTRTSQYPVEIIQEFRKAVEKISGNYMKEFLSAENFLLRLQQETQALFDSTNELIPCNSMSGFPLYELDFGMGKPIWACHPCKASKNTILMMSTPCGQGIEAWVSMLEDDVSKLDHSLTHLDYPIVKPMDISSSRG